MRTGCVTDLLISTLDTCRIVAIGARGAGMHEQDHGFTQNPCVITEIITDGGVLESPFKIGRLAKSSTPTSHIDCGKYEV